MKIDHTNMTATLRTGVRGRVAAVVRVGVAGLLACVAVGSVQAQDRGGYRNDDQQRGQQRDERGERNAQRQDAPRYEPRADERRQQADRSADAQRHSGRLTPDERRDLRRQINEAGVDLYPNTPPRR